MTSALGQKSHPPASGGPAADTGTQPLFADSVLQVIYDAAEPEPGGG
ncbi:hypothetical protein [Leucobacter tenebrionis]|nr:hypothetical protein [Leucobacter tenebrionis]QZY52253.1 hypothetical protein KVY00_01920 [Leucobacter tenebrionis]